MEKAANMASEKEGGRTCRKKSVGRRDDERAGRTVEKAAGHARDVAMVDVDPWGSFFEMFLGQTEGGSTDRHDGGRTPAKVVRTPGAKPGSQGRSPRAS
jgi:hypothetical protein